MACCGKTRTTASRPASSITNAGPLAGPATRDALFEYLGGRVLTVIGRGTGYQYRFVGFGACVSVDARDRASLAAVPQLRERRR
jgi:hypothetical protein